MMHLSSLAVFVIVPLLLLCPRQDSRAGGGAGSTSANFLKIGTTARATAMGEAFTAVADDATAIFWNPAGLALVPGIGLSTSHGRWINDMNIESFAYSQRFGQRGAVGASLTYLGSGQIREELETPTGEYGGEGGFMTAVDFAISGAYAQRLGMWWNGEFFRKSLVGVKATYIGQKTVEWIGYAVSLDVGYLYELKRKTFYIGGVVKNLGTRLKARAQPRIYNLGVAYTKRNIFGRRDRFILAGEGGFHTDTGIKINFGLEYSRRFGKIEVSSRAGYRLGPLGTASGLTTGLGLVRQFEIFGVGVDYAFVPYGGLGMTHRIGMSFRTGGGLIPPKLALEVPRAFTAGQGSVKIRLKKKMEENITGWKVAIIDPSGEPVRTFSGQGRPPNKIIWDGQNDRGELVAKAPYDVRFEVEDSEGQVGRAPPRTLYVKVIPSKSFSPLPDLSEIEPVRVRYEYSFTFSEDLLMESGSAVLRPKGNEALRRALSVINDRYPGAHIRIEGHTDKTPIGRISEFSSNEELSLARAEAVKNYLLRQGVKRGRLSVVGYAGGRPVASNDTLEGRAANRRVELIVYGEKYTDVEGVIQEVKDLMAQGSYPEAAEALERAIGVYPSESRLFRLLGESYLMMGKSDEALGQLRRAVELNPGDRELETWLEQWKKIP